MSDILERIVKFKKKEVLELKQNNNSTDLRHQALQKEKPRGFLKKLSLSSKIGFGLIAEIKKASPSKGIIRKDFLPDQIALAYQNSGASCISVLTDKHFFMGHNSYLTKVKLTIDLPVLRKDFIVDPIQIYESRIIGADCILLIAACLTDNELQDYYNIAKSLEMDVLIEIHNEEELNRALKLKPPMIGINNRNLKTMEVSLTTSINLIKYIPDEILVVSESGFKTHSDLKSMEDNGINCFLIGETFMKKKDIQKSVENILTGA